MRHLPCFKAISICALQSIFAMTVLFLCTVKSSLSASVQYLLHFSVTLVTSPSLFFCWSCGKSTRLIWRNQLQRHRSLRILSFFPRGKLHPCFRWHALVDVPASRDCLEEPA